MRAVERIDAIYAIAQHRAAYSAEEDAAHDLAAEWMEEAGLQVSRDEAGNLFGRRGDARVWAGSHLDSVPTACRFDGVLGVVVALEAADRLRDRELAVVAFRAEESGPMGSKRIAAKIKSGTVGINMPYTAFPGIPFGGYKQSGFGRELALETLDLYLETKSVVTYTGTRPTNPFGL